MKVWYSTLDDPRLAALEPNARWIYVYALRVACAAKQGGSTGLDARGLSVAARVDPRIGQKAVKELQNVKLLMALEGTTLIGIDASVFRDATSIRGQMEATMVDGVKKEDRSKPLKIADASASDHVAENDSKIPGMTEAIKFIKDFSGWYRQTYGRPLASATRGQRFSVMTTLRAIARDRVSVPEWAHEDAGRIAGAAATVAVKNRGQLWFLRNGQPLDLNTLTKHWQALWDRLIEEGQNAGVVAASE